MSAALIFEFGNVIVVRNGVRALDQFSAGIPRNGVTAIFGPSGSGKSTLMRLCNRLQVADSGRVHFDGNDIDSADPLSLRRRVGMCFQRPTPFSGTVRENLRAARADASDHEMKEALAQVALTGSWVERDAAALSGGEAQRMCPVGTMIARPEVLLPDEPTGLIFLPGAMTGLMLAGVAPLQAVLVQAVVMFLILGSAATSTVVVALGLLPRVFTADHRLLPLDPRADGSGPTESRKGLWDRHYRTTGVSPEASIAAANRSRGPTAASNACISSTDNDS